MVKRISVTSIVGVFIFILVMTAWDYCGPQPKQAHLDTKVALTQFSQIKFQKAHHPCASLKSPYDLVSSFRVSAQEISHSLKLLISLSGKPLILKNDFFASDPSPPFANPPPQTVPIFQLNSNLRI